MNDPHSQPLREEPTNLDLKILDVLREGAQGARLLAETLSQSDEQVGVDAVQLRLVGLLASRGLARPSGRASHRAEVDADQPTLAEEADPLWEITEEGRAVVERHVGVALAPYDRGVGQDDEVDDERDVAGLVVLLVIALLTAVCAAYSLLTAAGVLGG